MGQKVNPHGFRVGVITDWDARWIAKKGTFADKRAHLEQLVGSDTFKQFEENVNNRERKNK